MPFAQINYKRLFYTSTPPSTSDPSTPRATLILLHGLGSSSNFYYPIIPFLASHGYHLIALDYSGAGRSPYTQIEQSVQSYARDVVGLLDYLEIETAVVVGHSMSGMISTHLAAAHPTRIPALILLGSIYPTPALASTFTGRISTVTTSGLEPLADSIPLTATSRSASPLTRSFIRTLLLSSLSGAAGYVSNCRVIANAVPGDLRLGEVRCPALVVQGREDGAAPVDMGRRVWGELGVDEPRKKWVVLEGCGHWTVIEKPEEVQREIVGFLEEVLG